MNALSWGELLAGTAGCLVLAWVALVAALVAALATSSPSRGVLREAARLLPDSLRLLRRLLADRDAPRGVRWRVGLVLGYLALPIDLVPDFIPVLGWADDVIVVTLVLRSLVRRAGAPAVRRHWPGTDDGFAALCRLTGLRANSGVTAAER
nr:DUF1232 domain-containing protein [Saccharopolyspora sp. HNM0986]